MQIGLTMYLAQLKNAITKVIKAVILSNYHLFQPPYSSLNNKNRIGCISNCAKKAALACTKTAMRKFNLSQKTITNKYYRMFPIEFLAVSCLVFAATTL